MTADQAADLHKKLQAAFNELEKEYDCVFKLGSFGYSRGDAGFRVTVSGVVLTEPVVCDQQTLSNGFANAGTQFWVDQDRDGDWYRAVLIENKRGAYTYDLIGFEKSTFRYRRGSLPGVGRLLVDLPAGAIPNAEQAAIIKKRYNF